MQRILPLLQSQLVAQASRVGLLGAAETFALIADDRLNSREQLGRGHQATVTRVRRKTASMISLC